MSPIIDSGLLLDVISKFTNRRIDGSRPIDWLSNGGYCIIWYQGTKSWYAIHR